MLFRGSHVRRVVVFVGTLMVLTVIVVLRNGCLDAVGMGGEGSYAFYQHQPGDPTAPVTYSSCKPILVEINTKGVDDEDAATQAVLGAMGEVSAATGLHIQYVGPTARDLLPQGMSRSVLGGALPVLVAFTTPSEVSRLKGKGGMAGSAWLPREGVSSYVTGEMTLNAETLNRLFDRPGGRDDAKAIAMHEFGHIVGLHHVKDRGEIMYKSGNGSSRFGPGDRRGLALLGKGPCS